MEIFGLLFVILFFLMLAAPAWLIIAVVSNFLRKRMVNWNLSKVAALFRITVILILPLLIIAFSLLCIIIFDSDGKIYWLGETQESSLYNEVSFGFMMLTLFLWPFYLGYFIAFIVQTVRLYIRYSAIISEQEPAIDSSDIT